MKSKLKLVELIGWYGAGAILLAYALNSFEMIASDDLVYQLLNLTGALGIVVISYTRGVKQPAILNAMWAIIALAAIVQIGFN